MLPSNMLPLNLSLLFDVTFSTPTGVITSVRFSFALSRGFEWNGDLSSAIRLYP